MEEGESNDYSPLRNDEDEEDEENMEELEAMLYSQIYYDQSEVEERDFTVNDTFGDAPDVEKALCESPSNVDSGYEQSRPGSGIQEGEDIDSDDDSVVEEDFRPKRKRNYPAYPGSKGGKYNSKKRPDWSSTKALAEEAAKEKEVFICKDRGITKGCGEKFSIQSVYISHIKIRKLNHGMCPDLQTKDSSVKPHLSDSKYESAKGSAKLSLVENPFYDSDASSDSEEEDDGIILLPKDSPKSKETEVIEIDCDSSNSAVPITDSDTEDDDEENDIPNDDSIQIVEEVQNIKRKNDATEINKSLSKKRRTEQYKADFGSDFEDNFETDASSSSEDHEVGDQEAAAQTSSITLNLTSSSHNTDGRKGIERIVGCPLSRLRSKSVPDIPSHWSKEMDKFYNRVHEDVLDMVLDDVLKKLPRSSNWSIDRADLYGGGPQRSRYFTNKRCSNCNQIGHFARQCPEPEKDLRCHMCGHVGHEATRCPKKSCLWCGQPGFSFLESCMHCRKLRDVACSTCHYTGHVSRDCPDMWRRFHATCQDGDLVIPEENVNKPDRECWCCNCGRKGHTSEQCDRYQFSKYPLTSVKVISYKSSKFEFRDNSSSLSFTPSKAALEDEKSLKKSKKKKKSKTCPNTPDIKIPGNFMSEPSSPVIGRSSSFPTTLLVEKAITKLNKKKEIKQKHSQGLTNEVVRLMNVGKNKKQILAEILSNDLEGDNDYENNLKGKNKHLTAKRIKTAISSCMSAKKAEARQKEWRENRGFGQGHSQGEAATKEPFVGTRANLIPKDVRAAAKFLKKEVDKYRQGPVNSGFGKRLVKEINQEIFGLKTIQGHGQLKKVERKRLADLILELRKAS